MFTEQSKRAKGLGVVGVAVMALAIGAWTLPPGAETEGAADGQTMTIDINVPLNEIQDGQFCQAYALVWNGQSPYTFTWSGQFDNSYGSTGPLGTDQIVSGYIDESSRGEELFLKVTDSTTPDPQVKETMVTLNIDASYDYNSSCEA